MVIPTGIYPIRKEYKHQLVDRICPDKGSCIAGVAIALLRYYHRGISLLTGMNAGWNARFIEPESPSVIGFLKMAAGPVFNCFSGDEPFISILPILKIELHYLCNISCIPKKSCIPGNTAHQGCSFVVHISLEQLLPETTVIFCGYNLVFLNG